MKELIEEGEIDISAPGAGGRRPLHRAAGGNHLKVVKYLIEKGAKIADTDKSNRTALHWSTLSGHYEVTAYLLSCGANQLSTSTSNSTPLHYACDKGHGKIVELLMTKSHDFLEQLCCMIDDDGKSPCQLALDNGHKEIVDLMKELGDPYALVLPTSDSYLAIPDTASCFQRFNYGYINARTSAPWLVIDLLYILAVVVDGAFFAFMLVGLSSMNEEDSEEWLNWSIQILCALFSYPVIVEIPWRFTNVVNLFAGSPDVGVDFNGAKTDKIWFHLPVANRRVLTVCLVLNAVFQWVNQWSRIAYPSYSSSNSMPGAVLTNVFFAASFVFGIGGGIAQGVMEGKLRKENEGKFEGKVEGFKKAFTCERGEKGSDVHQHSGGRV